MLRVCFFVILFTLAFRATDATAETGVIRGGEHIDFTRLAIETSQRTASVSLSQDSAREFRLEITPPLSSLDRSSLFTRLNSDRVQNAFLDGRYIRLSLACDCDVNAFVEKERLVVIDVRDPIETSTDNPPFLLSTPQFDQFPGLQVVPNQAFDARTLIDYSVADRVSRNLAAQVASQRALDMVEQFIDTLPIASTPTKRIDVSHDGASEVKTLQNLEHCVIENQLQTIAEGSFKESTLQEPFLQNDTSDSGNAEAYVLQLVSNGLIEEAVQAGKAIGAEETSVWVKAFFAASRLKDQLDRRITTNACNSFTQILSLAKSDHKLGALTNSETVTLASAFRDLSLGLQLMLYPNLRHHFGNEAKSLFPDLEAHLLKERRLLSSEPDITTDNIVVDADAMAAVAIELSDTELEAESWEASFTSYLQNERFFDAFETLDDMPKELQRERQRFASKFGFALAGVSDPISFLGFATNPAASRLPPINGEAKGAVLSRLSTEGFSDVALDLAEKWGYQPRSNQLKSDYADILTRNNRPSDALDILRDVPREFKSASLTRALRAAEDLSGAHEIARADNDQATANELAWLTQDLLAITETEEEFSNAARALLSQATERDRSDSLSVQSAERLLENAANLRDQLKELVSQ